MSFRKNSPLPAPVESIRQAILGTHSFTQTRTSYEYRGKDVNSPLILKGNRKIRDMVSKEGRFLEMAENHTLLDSFCLGLYLLGKQDGYRECDTDLSHLRKIYQQIQDSQPTYYQY